jgi:hypothetical protein
MATPFHTPMIRGKEKGAEELAISPNSPSPTKFRRRPGRFHDQGDDKWIVIRGSLWGHNDTPCGWPVPGGPGWSGRPQGVIGVFLVTIIVFNSVPLIMEFTQPNSTAVLPTQDSENVSLGCLFALGNFISGHRPVRGQCPVESATSSKEMFQTVAPCRGKCQGRMARGGLGPRAP